MSKKTLIVLLVLNLINIIICAINFNIVAIVVWLLLSFWEYTGYLDEKTIKLQREVINQQQEIIDNLKTL